MAMKIENNQTDKNRNEDFRTKKKTTKTRNYHSSSSATNQNLSDVPFSSSSSSSL
jgi:hypothetical protein